MATAGCASEPDQSQRARVASEFYRQREAGAQAAAAGHLDGSSRSRRRSRQLKQGAAGPRHAEVRLATTALVLAEKGGQAPTLATRMPLRGGSAALQYPRSAPSSGQHASHVTSMQRPHAAGQASRES